MNAADRAELRRLIDAATSGEWESILFVQGKIADVVDNEGKQLARFTGTNMFDDAILCAMSKNSLIKLLNILDEAEAKLDTHNELILWQQTEILRLKTICDEYSKEGYELANDADSEVSKLQAEIERMSKNLVEYHAGYEYNPPSTPRPAPPPPQHVRRCTTHFHACDCREYKMALMGKVVEAAAATAQEFCTNDFSKRSTCQGTICGMNLICRAVVELEGKEAKP